MREHDKHGRLISEEETGDNPYLHVLDEYPDDLTPDPEEMAMGLAVDPREPTPNQGGRGKRLPPWKGWTP